MEANELRIGNYINWVGKKSDARIMNAYDFSIVYEATESNSGTIEPIPLTEEWLLKFGFLRSYKSYFISHYLNFDLFGDPKNGLHLDCENNRLGIEIKHVHQLQNLYFALTNEELCLKN